jgi:hypothetical protein
MSTAVTSVNQSKVDPYLTPTQNQPGRVKPLLMTIRLGVGKLEKPLI